MKLNKKLILQGVITIIVILLLVIVAVKFINTKKKETSSNNTEISETEKAEIMGVLYNDGIKMVEKYYPENDDLEKDDEDRYRYSFASFSALGENLAEYNTNKVKCNLEESYITVELDENGERTYYTDLVCDFR